MGRLYSATFTDVAVTADQDLFSILPAVDKPCMLHSAYITQNSDVADAEEELLTIIIGVGFTTVGSGGSAVTANPIRKNDAADGATVRANDTVPASTGTNLVHHGETFNVRVGWQYRPTPEERIRWENNEHLIINLQANPADSLTMSGTVLFEELV